MISWSVFLQSFPIFFRFEYLKIDDNCFLIKNFFPKYLFQFLNIKVSEVRLQYSIIRILCAISLYEPPLKNAFKFHLLNSHKKLRHMKQIMQTLMNSTHKLVLLSYWFKWNKAELSRACFVFSQGFIKEYFCQDLKSREFSSILSVCSRRKI